MLSLAARFAISTLAVILPVGWALSLDGYFLRPPYRVDPERALAFAGQNDASLDNVSLRASDGVLLSGCLFTPHVSRGRAVLIVHGGVGDHQQMMSRASWLLERGYTCLLVDQRGGGASGGVVTWSVKEPGDLSSWARWLRDRTGVRAVFGYGTSRGSTTLVQSLASRPPFAALAVECVGDGNIGRPYQFLSERMGVSEHTARMVMWPFIEPSFLWIRWRYGLNLKAVQDGVEAMRGSEVPVLIFSGTADRTSPLVGAERLRAANPRHAELVVVRGADHDWFLHDQPQVMQRVLPWFDAH